MATILIGLTVALQRPPPITRRALLSTASSAVLLPSIANAAATATAPTLGELVDATYALPGADARSAGISLRPDYGLESTDVTYPEWFMGRWSAKSTLSAVYAPAGDAVFAPGRNGTEALRRARLEVGDPLEYDVKWKRPAEAVVVDREYNVKSISRASMGANAVQDAQEDGPDHLTLVLKPAGAPKGSLFSADLRVVARRTDPFPLEGRPAAFACAEVSRQTVTTINGEKAVVTGPSRGPLIKEIETICTYQLDPNDPKIMRGSQRTATFLVPDAAYTGDPSLAEIAAQRLTRAPNGKLVAVDVRVYDLVYTRI